MANAIGTAYIKIMPDASGISGKINKEITPGMETAGTKGGKAYMGALKKVVVAAGVGAVSALVKGAVSAGADLQQSIGGIETLYKDSADTMIAYANEAYRTAGIDANTYMQQATSFSAALVSSYEGDVSKAAEATNQAMIDMADNANKMGTPLESIQNAYQGFAKQNYTMLDNLKLGYGGTKSEMERLLKDAEKISNVRYDISNLGDVYDAIHVIQGELGITGTTAEEAAQTISGSIGMMKAAWKDLLGQMALGNDIYPNIVALKDSIIAVMQNLIPAIGNVLAGIPKMFIDHGGEILAGIQNGARTAIAFLVGQFGIFIQKLPAFVSNIGNTIIANAPQIIDKVKTILQNVILWVGNYAPQILQAVLKIVLNIGASLIQNLPSILRSVFNLAHSVVSTGITTLFNAVKNGVAKIKDTLTAPFKNAVDKIKSIFPIKLGKLFDGIKLPHFKISGGKIPWGIGGAGEKPSVSVEWYQKAENQPYMFSGATLFGAGERNDEILYGRNQLMRDIAQATTGQVTINVYGAEGQSAAEIAEMVQRKFIEMQKRRTLAWQ